LRTPPRQLFPKAQSRSNVLDSLSACKRLVHRLFRGYICAPESDLDCLSVHDRDSFDQLAGDGIVVLGVGFAGKAGIDQLALYGIELPDLAVMHGLVFFLLLSKAALGRDGINS